MKFVLRSKIHTAIHDYGPS